MTHSGTESGSKSVLNIGKLPVSKNGSCNKVCNSFIDNWFHAAVGNSDEERLEEGTVGEPSGAPPEILGREGYNTGEADGVER